MKLKAKTFTYSLVLGIVIIGLVLSYMIVMLPSLYVDYQREKAITKAIKLHDYYIINKTYENYDDYFMLNDISLHLYSKNNEVEISNRFFDTKLIVKEEKILDILDIIKNINSEKDEDMKSKISSIESKFNSLKENYIQLNTMITDLVEVKSYNERNNIEFTGDTTLNILGNGELLMVARSSLEKDSFFSIFIVTSIEDEVFITIAPRVESNINDILPVVLRSIPMLLAVLVILLIIISSVYAKSIVNPIVKISNYTKKVRERKVIIGAPKLKGDDEITQLKDELEKLYNELDTSYKDLIKSSKGKELFLKSSSHNLKTPISTVLLLINSHELGIGKYKDKEVALPEIKKQVKYIEKIINEITYFNKVVLNPDFQKVRVNDIIDDIISAKNLIIESKHLELKIVGKAELIVDVDMFRAAIENLITNAISYTLDFGNIDIILDSNIINITNSPITNDSSLIGNSKEPLVGNNSGMGLYISEYYFELLGLSMDIKNIMNTISITIKPNK